MTGRVLVVDDILSNVKLLEAKLTAEYFEVASAFNGLECIKSVERSPPDVILLDVMMPGMDGFETCRRLKSDSNFAAIPIIMVTALSEPADRVAGLEAGADDFLTKPVDDAALQVRVRSAVRWKRMVDDLRSQTDERHWKYAIRSLSETPANPKVLLIEDDQESVKGIMGALSPYVTGYVIHDFQSAIDLSLKTNFDAIVVSLGMRGFDSLRLCTVFLSMSETRRVPIVVIAAEGDRRKLVQALELGISDYIVRPIDGNETQVRLEHQFRKKEFVERLLLPPSDYNSVTADHLLAKQDPLGAAVAVNDSQLSLVLSSPEKPALDENADEAFRGEVRRKLSALRSLLPRLSNSHGWSGLASTVEQLEGEFERPAEQHAQRALVFWSLSVSLASYLEQNRKVVAAPDSSLSPLDFDIERALSDAVVTSAPFVRGYETARRLDSELVSFNAPDNSVFAARRITASAVRTDVLAKGDANLLSSVLAHPDSAGVQTRKARTFGIKTVLNLIGTALVVRAAGGHRKIAELAVEQAAERSSLVKRLGDMLIESETDVVEIYKSAAPDLREAARQLMSRGEMKSDAE